MSLRLHILGSSGSWPGPGRPASGYQVSDGDTRLVLDLGFGTMERIPDPAKVDAVVVTHKHPDHCADVLALFHLWAYGDEPRWGIPLLAPSSVIDALAAFVDASYDHPFHDVFVADPVGDGDRRVVGSMGMTFVGMDHSVPANGIHIVSNDHSFFYTGDTGMEGEWWKRVEDPHLVLSEATWQGDGDGGDYTQHLTALQAGETASAMGANRLILTHIKPSLDPARSIAEAEENFDGPVSHAVQGATIET